MSADVSLLELAQLVTTNPTQLDFELRCPVLLWEEKPDPNERPNELVALGRHGTRPRTLTHVLFVRKDPTKMTKLVPGVSIGRDDNNDIVIPVETISGFHAYLRETPHPALWEVIDAHSLNGTKVGSVAAKPEYPLAVPDGATLWLSTVDVRFMLPKTFRRFLEQVARDRSQAAR